jgi:hypothetical protein
MIALWISLGLLLGVLLSGALFIWWITREDIWP